MIMIFGGSGEVGVGPTGVVALGPGVTPDGVGFVGPGVGVVPPGPLAPGPGAGVLGGGGVV